MSVVYTQEHGFNQGNRGGVLHGTTTTTTTATTTTTSSSTTTTTTTTCGLVGEVQRHLSEGRQPTVNFQTKYNYKYIVQ